MSVTILDGDLFADPAQVWVNAVNCVGPMGAGIAKQFKAKFPGYYLDYLTKCHDGLIELGRVDYYALAPVSHSAPPPLFIVSFPTMLNPGEASRQADLVQGLLSLRAFMDTYAMESVAIPALGCGIGQYEFNQLVKDVLVVFERDKDVHVHLYRPFDMRKHLDNLAGQP